MICPDVRLEDDLVEDILVDVHLRRPLLETGGLVRAYLHIFSLEVAVSVENPVRMIWKTFSGRPVVSRGLREGLAFTATVFVIVFSASSASLSSRARSSSVRCFSSNSDSWAGSEGRTISLIWPKTFFGATEACSVGPGLCSPFQRWPYGDSPPPQVLPPAVPRLS